MHQIGKWLKEEKRMNDISLLLSKKDLRYLEIAEKIAKKSIYGQFNHGAVLVKGGSIINTSFNKNKTSSFARKFRNVDRDGIATRHAELSCILNLNRSQTKGAVVYCVRIGRAGDLRISKPCSMCENALKFTGIKKIIYSTNDGFAILKL
jgi:tRNA(Arg) A34 adenosine deaminase TadA